MDDPLFDDDDANPGDIPGAPDRLWRHPAERGAELAAANMAGRQVVGRRWPAMVVSFLAGATLVGTMWLFTEPNDRPIEKIETFNVPSSTAVQVQGPLAFDEAALEWSKLNSGSIVALYLGTEAGGPTTQALLYRSDGHLIASAHAIAGATDVTAMMTNGQQLPAKIVATDSVSGIAVLKVNTPEVDPVSWWNEGAVNVQDSLVAIANPDQDNQVQVRTVDLLSADQVTTMPNGDLLSGLFRISNDLPAEWAGAALVNEHGGVVAMTVSGFEGANFAIPAPRLQRIADDLITDQTTAHKPWIGVHLAAGLTDSLKEQRDIRGGALLNRVFPNTPADQAGLLSGDVVISVDGHEVTTKAEFAQALRAREPGDEVTLEYSRVVAPTNFAEPRYDDPASYAPEIFTTTLILGAQPVS